MFLASGRLDFAGFGRPSLADAEFPNKVIEGRTEDIRQCLNCNQGCMEKMMLAQEVVCVVNPLLGREADHAKRVTTKKKKVFVAGGGIAGMEAAIFAAEDGHDVFLYESGSRLGGQWLMAAVPPKKTQLNTLTIWQKRRLEQLGVVINLNTALTPEIVEKEKPDAVIVATGGKPVTPPIPGVDGKHVVQAFDVLSFKTRIPSGSTVTVIGGGLVGAETATYLATQGCQVTVLEMQDKVAADMGFMNRPELLQLLKELSVNILTGSKVNEIGSGYVSYQKDGVDNKVVAETVVLAVGARGDDSLSSALSGISPKIIVIGDAKKSRKALDATREGYEAILQI